VGDIENEMDAAMKMGCAADNTSPAIPGCMPASGKAGQTATVTVAQQGLCGAVLALQGVDLLVDCSVCHLDRGVRATW